QPPRKPANDRVDRPRRANASQRSGSNVKLDGTGNCVQNPSHRFVRGGVKRSAFAPQRQRLAEPPLSPEQETLRSLALPFDDGDQHKPEITCTFTVGDSIAAEDSGGAGNPTSPTSPQAHAGQAARL